MSDRIHPHDGLAQKLDEQLLELLDVPPAQITVGPALLLPRPLLVAAVRRGETSDEIAAAHHVTPQMAKWRLDTTGARM